VAFKRNNPHNPSEVLGEFQEAGPYGVEIAVVRAREACLSAAPRRHPSESAAISCLRRTCGARIIPCSDTRYLGESATAKEEIAA
jgi:hypothetical protein